MRRILPLLIMLIMVLLLKNLFMMNEAGSVVKATVALGFILIVAHLIGHLFERINLPRITGYIVTGMVMGPYLLNLLDQSDVRNLKYIDDLAIAYIAFLAGAEMRYSSLKKRKKTYSFLIIGSIITVFTGITGLLLALKFRIEFFHDLPVTESLMLAAIMGVIALARSPSSAIAIINETKAKGTLSETVLGVAVGLDILVIIIFTVIMSIARSLLQDTESFQISNILLVLCEIAGSFILGILFGICITVYIHYIREDLTVLVLGMGFFVTKISHALYQFMDEIHGISFHIEPILMCMAAGFAVQNLSRHGPRFLDSLDKASLPIYVIFFSIAGASIPLNILFQTMWITLLLVAFRALFLFIGTYLGGKAAGEKTEFNKLCWLGLITQAGVSIGLMNEILRWFPEWSSFVTTIVIGTITINQLIGPIAFKYAIRRMKENRR